MPAPVNPFKHALLNGDHLTGLWLALTSPLVAEMAAQRGYDWVVVDAEHAPNDLSQIVQQLQAVAAAGGHAVVRPAIGEAWMIKRLLDAGAQTVLVPMVESAAQAQALVQAVRYPPIGIRGVGAALARASRFGLDIDYVATADAQICLLVQVESRAGLAAIEALCAVDGVDGIFVGPADLAADMGYPGQPGHIAVVETVSNAIAAIVAGGKRAGVLTSDLKLARRYAIAGASFVAIASDVGLLSAGLLSMLADWKAAQD